MRIIALVLLILALPLVASAQDWSCLNPDRTGWTGYMCGRDTNMNGHIDDCSELLACSRPSAGYCQRDARPYGYECLRTDGTRLPCGTGGIVLCPVCEAEYGEDGALIQPAGVVTPLYMYLCTLDGQSYPGAEMCQSACGAECQCSQGGLWNSATQRCEVLANIQCSEGYVYDYGLHLCVQDVTCPAGTHFDPAENRCVADATFTCPDGFLYNSATGRCQSPPDCGTGLMNAATGKCEMPANVSCPDQYQYSESSRRCEAQPLCATGVYNPATDLCEIAAAHSCPPGGYVFNDTTLQCETPPGCLPGGSYSGQADRCEALPGITCPSGGYVYDSALQECRTGPGCPLGGTYSPGTDRCEAASTPGCTAGYTYSAATELCEAPPQCASGYYNPATNQCELSVSPWCGFPYAVVASSSTSYTCAAPMQCLAGVYNAGHDRCEVAGSPQCSAGGYAYNPSYGVCASPPQCTSPGLYDSANHRCEASGSPSCPWPYSYSGASGQCQSAPQCASPGGYDPADNRCEAAISSQYTCSLNGAQYSALSACASACTQTQACSTGSTSLSGGGDLPNETTSINRILGNGNRITFGTLAMNAFWLILFEVTVGGFTVSGGAQMYPSGGPTRLVGNGGRIDVYNGSRFEGSLTVTGATVSGTISFGYADGSGTQWTGSGGALNCSGNGALYFSGASVCPLGSYACTGTPPSCTMTGSCTSVTSCPSGYTESGSVCWANATCPAPGGLNATVDSCQTGPTWGCPPAYVWNGTVCHTSATCLAGGSFVPSYNWCQMNAALSCPPGYIWNSTYGVCQGNPSCPLMGGTPGTFVPLNDRCEIVQGYACPGSMTWDSAIAKCKGAAMCAPGGSLDAGRGLCTSFVQYNCPPGYTYAGSGICAAPAYCPPPGSLNPGSDACGTSPVFNCPSGYTYSSGTCQAPAICPPPGALVAGSDVCTAPPAFSCPGPEWTFDPSVLQCRKPPACAGTGVFDSTADACWTDAQFSCADPAFSFNLATRLCEATPQCPPNSSISGAYCVTDPEVFCPQGTSYNPATGACESTPICSPPGAYNPLITKCSDPGSPDCPADYDFVPPDRCEAAPVCTPSDWLCPTDAADPVCNNTAPIMNKKYKEGQAPPGEDPITGELLLPPTITFASTIEPMSREQFEAFVVPYVAHPATLEQRDFIHAQYGNGPFWITGGVLYHDVYFNTEACYSYVDSASRAWRPRGYASEGCTRFPREWEKIETSCLCTTYREEVYERTCAPEPPFYTETLTMTFDPIVTDMSTCSGSPPFCTAGLQQQGLNDCTRNQTLYQDFITCSGTTVEKTRRVTTCTSTTAVTVPTEYRVIPERIFGIMQWDERKCAPCMTSDGSQVTDDVQSGPEPTIDQVQACQNFRMFSGTDRRCRPSGFGTLFSDCCGLSGWFKDWCTNEERELKKRKQAGTCHRVGTYCSRRLRFIGLCLQRKQSYCCFSSKLSRIINEEGREQIGKPWGRARRPDCKGFSPQEFSQLDFSSIDLSEYVQGIVPDTAQSPGNVMKGVQDWMTRQSNRSFLNQDK